MENPWPRIISCETDGDKVTLSATNINNIPLDRIIEIEIAAISTSHNTEGVL